MQMFNEESVMKGLFGQSKVSWAGREKRSARREKLKKSIPLPHF
jgi:hypothetical protein